MSRRLRDLLLPWGVVLLLPAALCAGRSAAAVETEAARSLVQAATADMLTSYSGKPLSSAESRAVMQRLVDRYCDMGVESREILGHYWSHATPAQQQEFEGLLRRFFITAVGSMIDGVSPNQRITVQGAERSGQRVVVHSLAFVPNQPGSVVDWVVTDGSAGKPVIVDVSTDGVALVTTLSADFTSVVRAAGGLGGLFAPLQRKMDELAASGR